jgi:hypothetical protein
MLLKLRHVALAFLLIGAFSASAQITVTAPAANETIRAADDYATQAFQDPWDMSQWTDLGWFTFGVDAPPANLSNITFTNGIFSATTGASGNFWLLDPFVPGSAPIGKIGSLFPIDSTKYRRFLIRMNLSGASLTNPPPADQYAYFIWNLFVGQSTSSAFPVYAGQWIYSVDIPTLGTAAGTAWASAPVTSLRFDPLNKSGINVSVDWARLVSNDPTLLRTITWNGPGPVDIFLDNDTNFANGYAGQIATGATGNSFQFYVGGLSAGTYFVAIRPTGSSSAPAYSAGAWTVNDIPTLTFTSPSPEGSADDFATTQLGNAWDMNALSDIDFTKNVSGLGITNISARDEAGNSLGNVRVFSGVTSGDPTDPEIFPLYSTMRGATTRIDTSRYRILTLKWGIVGNRDINAGSIGRVVWKLSTESVENVSDDLILNHLPNANVIQTISADMKTLKLEDGAGSPSHTGWNGLLDSFRIKPDEFSASVNFFVQSVKLTALEQADASYTIRWNYSNLGTAAPTLQFFWDTTGTGFNGTQIVAGLTPTAGTYTWNTSALANGTYYIYSRIVNGATVMNQNYARWPIVVQHGVVILPALSLDRSQLNFGVTTNGAATSSQVVHVATAAGVVWNAASNQGFVTVSPASGTGPGSFTVSVQSAGLTTPGNLQANVAVTSNGVSNSPQNVSVNVTVLSPSSIIAPIGSFDTPAPNATGIAGAIPVTGWALDQIEVTHVDILREPVVGEPQGSLIFIGTAVFVADARPDVQSMFSTYPFSYRAGWGYQMLTNFLPNASGAGAPGNGTYRIHAIAYDRSGLTTDLGIKTIGVDNAHAAKPFGTIDTPTQGGTISGTDYVNFAWALTQQPFKIPTDGSTITVVIDGAVVGHPVYNNFRSDIASLFPGYANSGGAVGFFHLNTTTLANGVHTISWNVFDNGGRGDGIGSRYFNVFNAGSGPVAAPEEPGIATPETVTIRRGIHPDRQTEPLSPDDGGRYILSMEELGRIELNLGATRGYLIINGERHALPLGSTLKNGVFHWQAGVGYLGQYELSFEQAGGGTVGVWVTIAPKTF